MTNSAQNPADSYDLHVYVGAFTPLLVGKANTICILHTNSALAEAAPNWLIDLRFTHLPDDVEAALESQEIVLPPNLRIGRMFPKEYEYLNCAKINDILHDLDHPRHKRIFGEWVEYWKQEVPGERAAFYTRNYSFFRLMGALGVQPLPLFCEIHVLTYFKYLNADADAAALSEIKSELRRHRDAQFDLIGQGKRVLCISDTIIGKLKAARPDMPTRLLRSGYEYQEHTDIELADEARDIDLLYAGQLYDWKGVPIIIEALRHCDPRIRLTIVGGRIGSDIAVCRQIAEHLGVNDRIDWVGQVSQSEVYAYQKRARLGLVPLDGRFHISKWFTSPIKVFELMAAGAPLLVADVPTLRSFLKDGETAAFARHNTPQAWGAMFDELLPDPERRYAMARNALEYVKGFSYHDRGQAIRNEIQAFYDENPEYREAAR